MHYTYVYELRGTVFLNEHLIGLIILEDYTWFSNEAHAGVILKTILSEVAEENVLIKKK